MKKTDVFVPRIDIPAEEKVSMKEYYDNAFEVYEIQRRQSFPERETKSPTPEEANAIMDRYLARVVEENKK